MSLPARKPIPFDLPATYQIRVQGQVAPSWSELLGGMTICPAAAQADPQVTSFEGMLSDPAALAGVLKTLYELHLPVLSGECLDV